MVLRGQRYSRAGCSERRIRAARAPSGEAVAVGLAQQVRHMLVKLSAAETGHHSRSHSLFEASMGPQHFGPTSPTLLPKGAIPAAQGTDCKFAWQGKRRR